MTLMKGHIMSRISRQCKSSSQDFQVESALTGDAVGVGEVNGIFNTNFSYGWMIDSRPVSGACKRCYRLCAAGKVCIPGKSQLPVTASSDAVEGAAVSQASAAFSASSWACGRLSTDFRRFGWRKRNETSFTLTQAALLSASA